jgi:hypothetical protein
MTNHLWFTVLDAKPADQEKNIGLQAGLSLFGTHATVK